MFLHLKQFFDKEDQWKFLEIVYDFFSWHDKGQRISYAS